MLAPTCIFQPLFDTPTWCASSAHVHTYLTRHVTSTIQPTEISSAGCKSCSPASLFALAASTRRRIRCGSTLQYGLDGFGHTFESAPKHAAVEVTQGAQKYPQLSVELRTLLRSRRRYTQRCKYLVKEFIACII